MKFFFLFILTVVIASVTALSQVIDGPSRGDVYRMDSLALEFKAEAKRLEQLKNDSVFSIRAHERNESEGELREAKRLERKAGEEAMKSRAALRKENRAQRRKERLDRRMENREKRRIARETH